MQSYHILPYPEASCKGMKCPAEDTLEAPAWREYPARVNYLLQCSICIGSEKYLCGALSPIGKIHGSIKLEHGSRDDLIITLKDQLWNFLLLSTQFWDLQYRGSALLLGSKVLQEKSH